MQSCNQQPQKNKVSNNELIQLFKENLTRKIKFIDEEKNSLEALCNSLINPILKFIDESSKKLSEIENSYYLKCHKIVVQEKNNPDSCAELIKREIKSSDYVEQETSIKLFFADLKRNKDILNRVKSNVYFQNFCEKNICDNQSQLKNDSNILGSNLHPSQINKIQSSIFPSLQTNLEKIKEVASNLFSQNINITPDTTKSHKNASTTSPISAFNNQYIPYTPPIQEEIMISDYSIDSQEEEESNGQRVSQMTQMTEPTIQSYSNYFNSNNNTYMRVFLKRFTDKKCLLMGAYSKNIKLNISVRMIIKLNSNSNNSNNSNNKNQKEEIPESISRLLELYFSDYFYHESGDFYQVGGIVKNSLNLRLYVARYKGKWDIEKIDIFFYEDYKHVLNYFRNGSLTSYSFSDLVRLSEEYPDCGGLDYVRDFIKVEISTQGSKSPDACMNVDWCHEDYSPNEVDIDKTVIKSEQ